jgi:hypothetical protein
MFTITEAPTKPPTREQIQQEYIAQLEHGSKVDYSFINRVVWAAYLVAAMRNARTHAELLDLLRRAVRGGYMGTRDNSFTGETPRVAYDKADDRLANTFWTDGRTVYLFWEGHLAPHLNDNRLSIDLEQEGFIAVHRGELPSWIARYVERRGKADNTEGWLAQMVAEYHVAAPRYIKASEFICVNCIHSTILKDYGPEFRATCDMGWPLSIVDDEQVTCKHLESTA